LLLVLLILFGIGNKVLNIFKITWSSRVKRGQETCLKPPVGPSGGGIWGVDEGREGISRFSA
jgi:hypothetical protein